ncbi:PREDICTED: gem-associated protein 2-like [Ipomoea nil]|uniref:gem-associated protein 2-like n=1 Tax=Ipomoea nil TaxID=35883 RepID=UPI0009008BFD|nr:PREDICTED: gem-associated protein 2-like [Ipomoea nil]
MSAPEHLPQVDLDDDDKKEIKNLQMGISETRQDSDCHAINDTFRQTIADNLEGAASEIGNGNNGASKEKKRNKPSRKGRAAVVEEVRQDCGKLTKEDKKGFYSRKELEAMRFVSLEEQKKKWIEVYCGLGADVQKEYDGLLRSIHQKQPLVDFDPRRKSGKARHVSFGDDSNSLLLEGQNPALGCATSSENDDSIVEREGSDYDDSDEDYSSIRKPAFFVTGEPNFDSVHPEDGLEYLRRVRWEAERLPNVKVAKVERSKVNKEQSVYMPQIPDIATCPEHLLPLKEWEDEFLADFSKLRQALSQLESSGIQISSQPPLVSIVHQEQSSHQLSNSIILEDFDSLTSGDDCSQSDAGDEYTPENSCPTLSVISGMEPVTRVSLLRKRITALESTDALSRDDCLWLFALCAAVDSPLDADTSASLRSLLRKCASLRAEKTSVNDEVIMLNVLATISGRYFGQAGN